MVISRKPAANAFKPDGIRFMGRAVEPVEESKLVGFIFDPKITMKPMVDHVARKARQKLGAIKRLQHHLDSKAFVCSSLEYGNLQYMSAGDSIKRKLDNVQAAAERLGGFSVEPLRSRREAALIGFAFKLLSSQLYTNQCTPRPNRPGRLRSSQDLNSEAQPNILTATLKDNCNNCGRRSLES